MQSSLTKEISKQKKFKQIFLCIILFSFLFSIIVPLFAGDYYINLISLIFIYSILAIGYNISAGFTGITSFAFAAHYGVGAYTSAIAISYYNVPFLLGLLLGALFSGIVGLIVSLPASKVRHHYLALLSIGLLEMVNRLLNEWTSVTGGSQGIIVDSWTIFGFGLDNIKKYYVIFFFLIIFIIVQRNLVKSRFGRDLIAMTNDEIAAGGLGINPARYRIKGYFLSSLIAGTAGSLYASFSGYISPDSFDFEFTVFVILMVILGGQGTLSGPIIGAIVATFLPELFNASPNLKQLVFGALLIFIPQVFPQGITGTIKKYFREMEHYFSTATIPEILSSDKKDKDEGKEILKIENLTKRFGGHTAVDQLNMSVKKGTIHALIGPNGAGKTTTVNIINGIDTASEGLITLMDMDITNKNHIELANHGVARTYQHVRLFKELTVLENVVVAGRKNLRYRFSESLIRSKKMRHEEKAIYDRALSYLSLVGLEEEANNDPGNLSAGQQKLLELARALFMQPDILILDEPVAGLSESERERFSNLISELKNAGLTMLLIEHHMDVVMKVSDHITVLNYGKRIADGSPGEILSNPEVKKAYLGEEE